MRKFVTHSMLQTNNEKHEIDETRKMECQTYKKQYNKKCIILINFAHLGFVSA